MPTLTYPDWRWGMKVTADRLDARQWMSVIKGTREVVLSSTTYQDDNELAFPVAANAHYFAIFTYLADGLTGADIKTRYSVPSGATGFKWCVGPQTGASDRQSTNMVSAVHSLATDRPYGCVSTVGTDVGNNGIAVKEYLRVQTSATAGNVTLQWAQNVSNGVGTIIDANSYVSWVRLA